MISNLDGLQAVSYRPCEFPLSVSSILSLMTSPHSEADVTKYCDWLNSISSDRGSYALHLVEEIGLELRSDARLSAMEFDGFVRLWIPVVYSDTRGLAWNHNPLDGRVSFRKPVSAK